MMQTFISIIIFFLGLGLVICVHELGHLSMAKLYRVYCEEFSIGFGPKLISINPKDKKTGKPKWETPLNIRALPLGGYVSMVGEDDDAALTEAGIPPLPKERTLTGISHPKQAIIMIAGIIMNVLLSYVLFLCGNLFCKQQDIYTNRITVLADSPLAQTEINTGDRLKDLQWQLDGDYQLGTDVEVRDAKEGKTLTVDESSPLYPYVENNLTKWAEQGKTTEVTTYIDIVNTLTPYITNNEGKPIDKDGTVIESNSQVPLLLSPKKIDISYSTIVTLLDGTSKKINSIKSDKSTDKDGYDFYTFGKLGLSYYSSYTPLTGQEGYDYLSWSSFGRAITKSFVDQGTGIANVYIALGSLFTPSGWQNVGGIISIFVVNEQSVGLGAYYVIWLWGMISINLAVMNLLPIPGLDGWQLFLNIGESIRRKPFSTKFKQRASTIGISCLFALMFVLIILDIVRLVI